jgi:hypothetical protein
LKRRAKQVRILEYFCDFAVKRSFGEWGSQTVSYAPAGPAISQEPESAYASPWRWVCWLDISLVS